MSDFRNVCPRCRCSLDVHEKDVPHLGLVIVSKVCPLCGYRESSPRPRSEDDARASTLARYRSRVPSVMAEEFE